MAVKDSAEEVLFEAPINHRIEVLKQKHETLDTALDAEIRRPMPDTTVISNLKREKLAVKDELERLSPI